MNVEDDLPEDEEDVDEYEVRPALVGDGEVFIGDPVELLDLADALALQVRDGALFLLKRDGRWVNAEDALKSPRSTVVQAVRTKQ